MKISPMEIQRQTFSKRLRGYDAEEVRTYLNLIAEELQQLHREHQAVQQEANFLRSIVDEHRQREEILKNTLLTAQRVSEEIKENARKQGQATVKEAELQADKLVELAQSRAKAIERETLDLRSMRQTLRGDIRALLDRIQHVMDAQEDAELDDNLRFMKRREGGEA